MSLRSFFQRLPLLLLLCCPAIVSHAQLLPPNQPEQDACTALQLCGNTFFTPYSYQGHGLVSDLTTTPCGFGTGEDNSVWLKLVVNTAGTIVFTITPVAISDDYDFAIINATGINCNNLSSANVIRCNYNNNLPVANNGVVGLNTTSTVTSVAAGTTGSPYLQQITAAAGDTYLIMINNSSSGGGASSGFTINFAGSTAVFFDNTPPHFSSLVNGSPCSNKNGVTVNLNTQVACNSIAANGSDFQLSPSGTVISASGVNCSGTNGYTNTIVVNFSPALAPGNYAIKAKTGTDNNTLLNLCGTALSLPDSLSFTVAAGPVYSQATLACTKLTVQTTTPIKCSSVAANGSDFHITGPAAVSVAGAVGVGCNAAGYSNTIDLTLAGPITATGTYTLTAQNGSDGNTLTDSCNTNQVVGNNITFHALAKPVLQLPDSLTTCSNTGVVLPLNLTNADVNTTYTYSWTPTGGLSDATIKQPLATPSGDQTYVVTVGSNDATMCTAKDSVFVHGLQGFTLLNHDTTICDGSSVTVHINGSDEYTYSWTPATGVSNPAIKEPVLTPAATTMYTVTAKHPGCRDSVQTLKINVEPNPTNIKLVADPGKAMCQGDTIVLHAVINPPGFNFTYVWTPAGDLQYTGGPNNAFFGDTSVTIKVTATTPIGCVASDSVRLTVYPTDFGSLLVTDTGVCPLDTVQLAAAGGTSYAWSPAYGLSDTAIANPLAAPLTTTDYTVVIKDIHGCIDKEQIRVSVYPAAVLQLPDSVTIYPGESYAFEPGTNCLYFQWFPASGLSNANIANPMAQPQVRTRYFVKASTQYGCPVSDSVDVLVKETVIDIPNAFTPTGVGNHTFKPAKRGIATLNYFRIFNRWGQVVFETTDIEKGWDGTFKGAEQPLGVYTYLISAITDSGQTFTREGNVTLLR